MGLPKYALLGLSIIALSEAAMFAHIQPFWSWHTPIAWTGYILFVDGYVHARRGSSWLTTHRREFVFLAIASIPLWVVFEGYNLLIHNWHYINLPPNVIVRYFGYGWAFAAISPAIFETAELVAVLRATADPRATPHVHGGTSDSRARTSTDGVGKFMWLLIGIGAAMLIWPLVWPSPYLSIPVWLGFIFLLDPVNAQLGAESLLSDFSGGRYDRLINLGAAGFVCGVLWEFWNYWSLTKWIYTVPYMPTVKIFEMPVLGYFGFPAFAFECFAMYVFVQRVFWHGSRRAIGL